MTNNNKQQSKEQKMNTKNMNKEIIDKLASTAISSGLVDIKYCWTKRVKVATGSLAFDICGEIPDSNAWELSFNITSLRSSKKVNALLEELAALTSPFKNFDGYRLRFCKADKYVSIVLPDNEKYAA